MATIMSLLFLLARSSFTTANHRDSEACADPSIPMTWEVLNLTVSGSTNTTYNPNDTVAAPYHIKFAINNTYITWPQDCEAEVPSPDAPESDDGDSGWLFCGPVNVPPERSGIQQASPIDDDKRELTWKEKFINLFSLASGSSKVQVPPGSPGIHVPVGSDGRPLAVIREQIGPGSNNVKVPPGSPTAHDPVDVEGNPLALIRAQPPPRRRPAIEDYGQGWFRFNRSSGELYITQLWGCYEGNSTKWITIFQANGSTTILDFSCAATTPGNDTSIPRAPVRLLVNEENVQDGNLDVVKDDEPGSDGVTYDCVPGHVVTVIPSDVGALELNANETCMWNSDCIPPEE